MVSFPCNAADPEQAARMPRCAGVVRRPPKTTGWSRSSSTEKTVGGYAGSALRALYRLLNVFELETRPSPITSR
jgi:hypothetical protein